jgi:diadenosine tetraphosphate (Ap4A) HIT family hydrolase
VIPKAHRAQIWDMADAEFAAVYRTLPTLVRALARATGADAVNVLSLNGRAGGQTVFHLHFHLIPIHRDRSPLRREGRRVALEFIQHRASRTVLDQIARQIRGHLAMQPWLIEESSVGTSREPKGRRRDYPATARRKRSISGSSL